MTTGRVLWCCVAAALALVLTFGPDDGRTTPATATVAATERPLDAPETAAPGPPAITTAGEVLRALEGPTAEALTPAVPVARNVCLSDPDYCNPPLTVPDPLDGYHGTFRCIYATAGRVTPCCPNATSTLALFWSGFNLAVADYIVGREGGCDEDVINSAGCVGWFQLCGWRCDGPCTSGYANAEKARWLYDRFGWCSTGSWFLAGDRVTGRGGAACGG